MNNVPSHNSRPFVNVAAEIRRGAFLDELADAMQELVSGVEETGNAVIESEFIHHPKYDFIGCSPDGLIDENGGLEIKSPKSPRVHIERFLDKLIPDEYIPQVQGCMWVTGREWWDFASFDPRMPPSHQILIIRAHRDEKFIANLEKEVLAAEIKVQEFVNLLLKKAA